MTDPAPGPAPPPAPTSPARRLDEPDLRRRALAGDPDRARAACLGDHETRRLLFTILLANHELARAWEAASEPGTRLLRLQWWRDRFADLKDGQGAGRHELAADLEAALAQAPSAPASLAALERILEARDAEVEADGRPWENLDAMETFARETAGALALALGAAAAGRPLTRPEWVALETCGTAWGLTGLLRAAPYRRHAGLPLLPAQWAKAVGDARVLGVKAVIQRAKRLDRDGRDRFAALDRADRSRLMPAAAYASLTRVMLARLAAYTQEWPEAVRNAPASTRRIAIIKAALTTRL